MEPQAFKRWRVGLGLSQKDAARELGLAPLTIQQYERGYRYDNFKPSPVPKSVELACKNISSRFAKDRGELALNFDTISEESLEKIVVCLMKRGITLTPKHLMGFQRDNFMPFSAAIFTWLTNNASDEGYLLVNVNSDELEDSGVVILNFFDRVDAVRFTVEFQKRGMPFGNGSEATEK